MVAPSSKNPSNGLLWKYALQRRREINVAGTDADGDAEMPDVNVGANTLPVFPDVPESSNEINLLKSELESYKQKLTKCEKSKSSCESELSTCKSNIIECERKSLAQISELKESLEACKADLFKLGDHSDSLNKLKSSLGSITKKFGWKIDFKDPSGKNYGGSGGPGGDVPRVFIKPLIDEVSRILKSLEENIDKELNRPFFGPENNGRQSTINNLHNDIKKARDKNAKLDATIKEKDEEIKKLKQELKEAFEKIVALEKELPGLRKDLTKSKEELVKSIKEALGQPESTDMPDVLSSIKFVVESNRAYDKKINELNRKIKELEALEQPHDMDVENENLRAQLVAFEASKAAELSGLENKWEELLGKEEDLKKQTEALITERNNTLAAKDEIGSLRTTISDIKSKYASEKQALEHKLQETTSKLEKIEKQLKELNEQPRDMTVENLTELELKNLRAQLVAFEASKAAELSGLENTWKELLRNEEELKKQTAALVTECNNTLVAKDDEISSLKTRISGYTSEKQTLEAASAQLEKEKAALSEKLEETKSELKNTSKRLRNADSRNANVSNISNEEKRLSKENRAYIKHITELTDGFPGSRDKMLGDLRAHLEQLREDLGVNDNSKILDKVRQTKNSLIEELLKYRQDGSVKGEHNRLSQMSLKGVTTEFLNVLTTIAGKIRESNEENSRLTEERNALLTQANSIHSNLMAARTSADEHIKRAQEITDALEIKRKQLRNIEAANRKNLLELAEFRGREQVHQLERESWDTLYGNSLKFENMRSKLINLGLINDRTPVDEIQSRIQLLHNDATLAKKLMEKLKAREIYDISISNALSIDDVADEIIKNVQKHESIPSDEFDESESGSLESEEGGDIDESEEGGDIDDSEEGIVMDESEEERDDNDSDASQIVDAMEVGREGDNNANKNVKPARPVSCQNYVDIQDYVKNMEPTPAQGGTRNVNWTKTSPSFDKIDYMGVNISNEMLLRYSNLIRKPDPGTKGVKFATIGDLMRFDRGTWVLNEVYVSNYKHPRESRAQIGVTIIPNVQTNESTLDTFIPVHKLPDVPPTVPSTVDYVKVDLEKTNIRKELDRVLHHFEQNSIYKDYISEEKRGMYRLVLLIIRFKGICFEYDNGTSKEILPVFDNRISSFLMDDLFLWLR